MGDAPARTELKVTTGPIRGSRKIYVEGRDGVRVAMRAVDLEPSSGEPPVVLYDTSGPYSDPQQRIDIMAGLPELRLETDALRREGRGHLWSNLDKVDPEIRVYRRVGSAVKQPD